jgi:hypothetical protein
MTRILLPRDPVARRARSSRGAMARAARARARFVIATGNLRLLAVLAQALVQLVAPTFSGLAPEGMAPPQLRASLAGLLLPLAAGGAALPTVPVFTFGEKGYPVFREPAIVLLPSGNLLAFIEGGQNHVNDEAAGYPSSNSAVVSKLSSNGGRTWGKLDLVLKNSSQPGAVYDSVRKQVVLNLNGAPHCLGQATPTGCGFNLQMISKDGVCTNGGFPPTSLSPIKRPVKGKIHRVDPKFAS